MSLTRASSTPEDQPSDIHERLVNQDPLAPSDLAIAFLDDLAAWLERRYPQIDPHMCCTAAEDAILALIKNPKSFDPARQSLPVYLRMSASGDLKNALHAEDRHRKRRADLQAVELSAVDRKSLWDVTDPALLIERRADDKELAQRIMARTSIPQSVQDSLTQQEAKVLELMQLGERRTRIFAGVLSVGHLSPKLQRQEVKRVKDRLKRRLERAGETK